jgi:2-keto-4-pentenoate hydratase/2-oxohepta-3-ene-1,7-dioic acid hydratase in catechol pathway
LAGNYAEHIEEGGGKAASRESTFPYLFCKPPTTTLVGSGSAILLPAISPDHIDWEVELGIIVGKLCRNVLAKDALDYVAGYTVVNDVSNRKFRPNPNRKERPSDKYFDWLHGKWFDTFAPVGPCILGAASVSDPQSLDLRLRVNGELKQDSNSGNMIFGVAGVLEFVSSIVTLERGDLISTGTPSGVGATDQTFLRPGDWVEAEIERIGVLRNPVGRR